MSSPSGSTRPWRCEREGVRACACPHGGALHRGVVGGRARRSHVRAATLLPLCLSRDGRARSSTRTRAPPSPLERGHPSRTSVAAMAAMAAEHAPDGAHERASTGMCMRARMHARGARRLCPRVRASDGFIICSSRVARPRCPAPCCCCGRRRRPARSKQPRTPGPTRHAHACVCTRTAASAAALLRPLAALVSLRLRAGTRAASG